MRAKGLNGDPLYLVQRDLFLAAVVEQGRAGRLLVGDVLRRPLLCFGPAGDSARPLRLQV